MKKQLGVDVSGSYEFNPAGKTITFSSITLSLNNILLITNVTDNVIIYNFADESNGAAGFANNVLTLDYDTSAMSSNDVLQIYLDLESNEETLHALLRRMNKLLESNATVDSALRQRVSVEVLPSVTVGSAPSTAVTNTTGFGVSNTINTIANPYNVGAVNTLAIYEGPVDQRWRIIDSARASYGTAIRSNLIF
jgi:hypothetical protein